MRRLWMVCYDIEDDGVRQRVAAILEGFGERVQWSVFECHLSANELAELQRRLLAEIDSGADSVRWYPVCVWCRERVVPLLIQFVYTQ